MEAPTSLYYAVLALLMFHYLITSSQATSLTTTTTTNTDFIKKSCNSTLYPELCYEYLSPYASRIGTSPRLLAQTAIAVTLSETRASSAKLINCSKIMKMNAREVAAMRDCLEEVSDSVYELKKSLEEMGHAHPGLGYSFVFVMSNIQTWVSAALTDDDTCMDGFSGPNMNGNIKTIVRGIVLNIAHLTSIALSFINNYASSG